MRPHGKNRKEVLFWLPPSLPSRILPLEPSHAATKPKADARRSQWEQKLKSWVKHLLQSNKASEVSSSPSSSLPPETRTLWSEKLSPWCPMQIPHPQNWERQYRIFLFETTQFWEVCNVTTSVYLEQILIRQAGSYVTKSWKTCQGYGWETDRS